MSESGAHVGLIGLAVMGQNLALNIERNGYPIAAYNRTGSKTEDWIKGPAHGKRVIPAFTLREFVAAIERPRQIIMMVQAGGPVDDTIAQLRPLLEEGDVL